MKCKICGSESGRYPLCRACNIKKEQGQIVKCEECGKWHAASTICDHEIALKLDAGEYQYEFVGSTIHTNYI